MELRDASGGGTPAYRAETPWPAWRALLAAVGIVAVASVAGVAATMSAGATGLGAPAVVLGLLATQTVMIVLTLVAARMFGSRPQSVLALGKPVGGPLSYVQALAILAAALAVYNGALVFGFGHDFWADIKPFAGLIRNDGWLLALLAIGIGAPVSEELLFRGFLQSALSQSRLAFAGAAAVSTAFWSALHIGYSLAGMVEVALIGGLFSWLLYRFGSIRITLLAHAIYNTLLVLVVRFAALPF